MTFDPLSEARNDTYVLDPENVAEMARLVIQAQLVTQGMGGALPDFGDGLTTKHPRVLDLGCGPGEWVRQVARENPLFEVSGIDISKIMIAYAQSLVEEERLNNAHFIQGNLLQPLDFPGETFDILYARLLVGVLRRERWPMFLQECRRLLKPGGYLCLTECDDFGSTNKPSRERINKWGMEMLLRGGYGFATNSSSEDLRMASTLTTLLTDSEWSNIRSQDYILDFSAGTPLIESMRQNMLVGYKQWEPVLLQMNITTIEDFQEVYATIQDDITAADFQGTWKLCMVQARKPEEKMQEQ